jgi:hypothetical protein
MGDFNTKVNVEQLIHGTTVTALHDRIYALQQENDFLRCQIDDLRLALQRYDIEAEANR